MEGALGPGGVDGGVAPAPTPQASGFPDASQRLGTQVDVCVAPVDLIVNRPAEYAEKVGQTAKGLYIDAPIALGKTALNLGKTVASEHYQFYTDPLGTSIRYGKIATGLAVTVADAVYNYDQTWDSIKETASSLPKTIDDWIVHTPLDKQGQFFGEIGWGIALGRAAEITFTRALSALRWVDDVVPDARGPAPKGARGHYCGRQFNKAEAGGPIRHLTTDRIKITNRGIDVVEQHLTRFGPDEANQIMVQRLRDIAAGRLKPTQVDLNFYSHELREFVRFRRLGHSTGAGDNRRIWNNAHTASLEDYHLKGEIADLYHPRTGLTE